MLRLEADTRLKIRPESRLGNGISAKVDRRRPTPSRSVQVSRSVPSNLDIFAAALYLDRLAGVKGIPRNQATVTSNEVHPIAHELICRVARPTAFEIAVQDHEIVDP